MSPTRLALGVGSVLTTALLLAGCGSSTGPESTAEPASTGAAATEPTPTATPAEGDEQRVPAPADRVVPATSPGLRPERISIPAIDVDIDVVDLGIADDGAIEVPADPDQVGWLDTTPAPGQQGPAVMAGHVDSETGPAVFARLDTLAVGDEVTVTSRDGSTSTFTVDGLRTYAQDAFPTADVYGPVPAPALRLITCGGAYVASDGGYQDNVVVYAS